MTLDDTAASVCSNPLTVNAARMTVAPKHHNFQRYPSIPKGLEGAGDTALGLEADGVKELLVPILIAVRLLIFTGMESWPLKEWMSPIVRSPAV
jgi:hypothetical protein